VASKVEDAYHVGTLRYQDVIDRSQSEHIPFDRQPLTGKFAGVKYTV
jgi:hypothetical protein